MNYKKIIFSVSFLAAFVSLFSFNMPAAGAMTAAEIQTLIAKLQAQIVQLQEQLTKIGSTAPQWCYDFNVNLKIGMGGAGVEALHIALEKEGFSISGDEKTNKDFEESTASSVTGFQEKYRDEILNPLGLKYGTGYVAKATRAKLNQIYGCGAVPAMPVSSPTPIPTLTPVPTSTPTVCIQVVTPAQNPQTGECKNFPTPCDVPAWWKKVSSCPTPTPTPTPTSTPTPTPVPECKAFWWYDNDYSYCQQKKFCGAYMYLGLRTFSTEAECKASLSGKSLTLISPNGGEKWQVGNTYNIAWKSSGIEKVNINIFNSRNLFGGLGLGTFPASQGSYSWTIPNDFIDVRTIIENWKSGDSFQILILEEKSDRSFGIEDRSDSYFNIVNQSTENLPPVIYDISGPATLKFTEIGTWTVKASDPEKGILTYSVIWGDNTGGTQFAPKEATYVQTTTFSHLYFKTGTYNLVFIVTDDRGLSAKSSISVRVEELITTETGFHRFKLLDSSLCPGCVVGTVCQPCPPESERTIYNGKISVYDAKGNLIATKDTSSGMAVFENLLYGIYTVTISAPGFESSKSEFIVGATFGTDSTVNMKKISTTQPSLTIISPNGGELWEVGKTYTIQWKSENLPSGNNITIELLGSSGTKVLFSSIANNANSQNWTIPKDFPVGTYILKVISYAFSCGGSNSSCGDDAERPFSIVATTIAKTCTELATSQKYYFNLCSDAGYDNICFNKFTGIYQGCTRNPNNDCTISNANAEQNILCPITATSKTITVLSPNGGESWEIWKTYTIKWTTTGYSSDAVVRIIITDESSGTETPLFNVYNIGSYGWTIPSTYQTHSNYKIKIVAPDEKYDKSDAPFSIVPPQPFVVPPQSIACTDSDNGNNINLKGCTTYLISGGAKETVCDFCRESYIQEYFCQDNKMTYSIQNCPNGCQDGACLATSVTVLYPNGKESWTKGLTYTIKWYVNGSFSQGSKRVILEKSGAPVIQYVSAAGNADLFNLTLSSDLIPGDDYKIKVELMDTNGKVITSDTSDNYFSIISGGAGLNYIENQLADISRVILGLLGEVRKLVGK